MSFRTRLAVQTMLVSGVLLAAFGAASWWYARQQLARDLDLRITESARRIWVRLTPRTTPAEFPEAMQGTHDDLHATSIALDVDGQRAILISCDLIAADPTFVGAARQEASRLTGIPVNHIMLSATHSHTGPLFNPRMLAAAEEPACRRALRPC